MESEERPSKMRKLDDGTSQVEDTTLTEPESGDKLPQNGNLKSPEQEHGAAKGEADVGEEADEQHSDPGDTNASNAAVNGDSADPPMSKNQLKKLRKKAEWEAKREDRKIVRKEKQQAKRERKKAAKQEAEANPEAGAEEMKQPNYQKPVQLPITIIIDCDFDDKMHDGERTSLAGQLTRSYSDNKNSKFRAHLTICSFGGKLRERFDGLLKSNYKSWRGVRTFDCDFVETAEKAKEWMSSDEGGQFSGSFSKYADLDDEAHSKLKEDGEIVYLTSEADEDLTELKPYSTYIIGGLVDKNREKGICYKRATARNVKTAKLPIGEFLEMSSRKVLATNHVNEIMLKWLECGEWGEAFMKVIPKRKGGKLKGSGDVDENETHDDPDLSDEQGIVPEQPLDHQ